MDGTGDAAVRAEAEAQAAMDVIAARWDARAQDLARQAADATEEAAAIAEALRRARAGDAAAMRGLATWFPNIHTRSWFARGAAHKRAALLGEAAPSLAACPPPEFV